ncbi:MAG: hypothetical protein ACE5DQ_01650, partial [Candidatus Paceibacterota bacterium]
MNLKTITTQALLDYINRLSEQGYSDSEIIRKIKAVNDYISWGYNKGHISLSQFKQLESVLAKQQLKLTESYTDNSFSRALSSSFPISNSRIAAPLRNYAGTFALLLISSILISSIFVYVSKRGKSVLVYKSKASSESQTLTYKGQLTDKKGIPIVSPVQSIFRLYPNNTDTISIYDSGVCN